MKADKIAPIKPIIDICPQRLFPNAEIFCPIKKIAPELIKPFDTIKTKATIMVAGWAKPSNASLYGTTPIATEIIRIEKDGKIMISNTLKMDHSICSNQTLLRSSIIECMGT